MFRFHFPIFVIETEYKHLFSQAIFNEDKRNILFMPTLTEKLTNIYEIIHIDIYIGVPLYENPGEYPDHDNSTKSIVENCHHMYAVTQYFI